MVLDARERLRAKHPKIAARITPQVLSTFFRYVRNLSLVDRRLTPDLYTLIVAAKQTAGDDFALALAEAAREYPYRESDRGEDRTADGTRLAADGDPPRRRADLGDRPDGLAGCRASR